MTSYTDPQPLWVTHWIDKSCCCFNIAYFPDAHFTVCGHWRTPFKVPIIISIVFLITFASLIYDILPVFPKKLYLIIAIATMSFLAFCVILSYFLIIVRGPGYVPYTWERTRRKQYTWEEFMTNMVVYSEQEALARAAARPPRSSFSIDARRFVLRADHFCLWCQSWVGLLNHRYFLLMTGYVPVYALAYLVCRVFWVAWIADGHFSWWILIGAVSTFVTTVPGLIGVHYFCQAARNVIDGVTAVELFHNRAIGKNQGCVSNCEEICGPLGCCCCWCCPFCVCIEPAEDGFYSEATPVPGSTEEFSYHTGEGGE
jgi:hypothetical protein